MSRRYNLFQSSRPNRHVFPDNTRMRRLRILALAAIVLLSWGCSSTYYSALETVGVYKRDLLVKRVEAARDSQLEAKEEFQSALERFRTVVQFDGGDLEAEYRRLDKALDRSEARAEDVKERIESVEDVATDLFAEWRQELGDFNNPEYRRSSEQQLLATERRYDELHRAMERAEARIEPVLIPLRDQVLYLKHQLNAKAIAALEGELNTIEVDTAALIAELETAIAQADRFIDGLG